MEKFSVLGPFSRVIVLVESFRRFRWRNFLIYVLVGYQAGVFTWNDGRNGDSL